ncbi:SRPBCC family protein [Brunnivagina elsteri]|uniref:Cyclase n=1 Tax=Brunnivagina elsteri CCALA 953 TaxID=987040 RepID=A0A2A2TF73_9CYAN|nr:SRPBCC family protein [Calothrix elsteri]PAX52316.1 cyclase [Calothrix elsteri CCALA 953]
MSAFYSSDSLIPGSNMVWSPEQQAKVMQGEVILETRSHTAWGGAVTAWMYLPITRSHAWQQLTDYPRWVQYFPDIIKSELVSSEAPNPDFRRTDFATQRVEPKRLYQAAQKAFLFFTAQVEIYLNVAEELGQKIQFRLEKGSFHDFTANIELQDFGNGTLLKYAVQATPTIPVPAILIQQAMNFELPANMRKMRQVLCKSQ